MKIAVAGIIAICIVLCFIVLFYKSFKNIDEDETIKTGKEIHNEALISKLENLKKMVIQNDNDLLLKVITQEDYQKQLANYNKQIDEIEKELNNER